MRFCTSCGSPLTSGIAFCTSCGARLGTADPAPQAPLEGPPVTDDSTEVLSWSAQSGEDRYDRWHDDEGAEPDGRRRRPAAIGLAVLAVTGAVAAGLGVATLLRDDPDAVRPVTPGVAAAETNDGVLREDAAAPAGDGTGSEDFGTGRSGVDDDVAAFPSAETPAVPPASRPLQPVSVTADCFAPPSQDSLDRTVTYGPERVTDGVPETAWRCTGAAVGQRLVLRFAAPVTVTSVGLVPGYDKVDPVDGIDRFTETRTVTAVEWAFDDGSTRRQDIPNPTRELARLDLDAPVSTSTVTLLIAATGNDGAPRDYTPVSEVEVVGY